MQPTHGDDDNPIEALTGPFYDHTGAATALHTTTDQLNDLVITGQVLQLTTVDGTHVYPSRQFTQDGRTVRQVADILAALRSGGADPWAQATWLSSAADGEWDGMNAWQWLAAGRDPNPGGC